MAQDSNNRNKYICFSIILASVLIPKGFSIYLSQLADIRITQFIPVIVIFLMMNLIGLNFSLRMRHYWLKYVIIIIQFLIIVYCLKHYYLIAIFNGGMIGVWEFIGNP